MTGQADRLEGVVEAAGVAGDLALQRGQVVGSTRMRRTEALGHLELVGVQVDGDDDRRAGHAAALDDRDADATAAEHHARRARRHLGGVDRRADTGGHATADERRDLERHVVVDLDGGLLGNDQLLGERARAGHAVQIGVAPLELG